MHHYLTAEIGENKKKYSSDSGQDFFLKNINLNENYQNTFFNSAWVRNHLDFCLKVLKIKVLKVTPGMALLYLKGSLEQNYT